MSILTVNYDVIFAVFSYLDGRHMIDFALASKQAHEIAIPFLAANAQCSTPVKLESLRNLLLSSEKRAMLYSIHLKNLTILRAPSTDTMPPSLVPGQGYPENTDIPAHIGDILHNSPNLRKICMNVRDVTHSEQAIDISCAIAALERLREAQLLNVGIHNYHVLQAFPSGLVRLTVRFDPGSIGSALANMLLFALSSLPDLREASLIEFTPLFALAHRLSHTFTITDLILLMCSPLAIQLADFCPKLESIKVFLDLREVSPYEALPSAHCPWPHLRCCSLRCTPFHFLDGRLISADALEIDAVWPQYSHYPFGVTQRGHLRHPEKVYTMESVVGLARQVRPCALYIILAGSIPPSLKRNLEALSHAAPQLRILDFSLQRHGYTGSDLNAANMASMIIETFAPFAQQIVFLRFSMSMWPLSWQDWLPGPLRVLETATHELPQRLANRLPLLRAFGIATQERRTENVEMDSELMTGTRLPLVEDIWWRVSGKVGSRTCERITEREGEAIRSAVLCS